MGVTGTWEGDERRRRARRIDDVPLLADASQRSARQPMERDGAAPGRVAFVALLCAPAVVLAGWLAVELLSDSRPIPAALAATAALVWIALLLPILRSSSRSWTVEELRRKRTARAARRGLARNEFVLEYQPQVDLQTGVPSGVEALVRWHRGGRTVPPAEFLPAVESSDVIVPLTERILEMAVAQAEEWHRSGRDLRVAVNLSASNLADFAVVGVLDRLLARHAVPPELLVLEVTETTVLENPERTRAVLEAIAERGVAISIDDFGIGYSSLLWLRIFPIDEVKVDRSFVAQMSGEGRAFVEGVIRLARDLSMRVVAEGIELESALAELQELGCRSGQGFLFARPMPAEQVAGWFDAHRETGWGRRETTISIDPDFDQIATVRDVVTERSIQAGMSRSEIWDMRVAVTEALANAIEHGPRAEDDLIHVRIAEEGGELRLDVAGGGRGADAGPTTRDPERGRGISIMTGTMDRLRLSYDRDRSLTRMAKSLRPPGPS